MWIYIAHIVKLTSNALVTPALIEEDCFEEPFETVKITRRWYLSSSGSEFQTVGPATGIARRPYVLSRRRNTMSRCRLAERSRCRNSPSVAGLMCSARYQGACPCKQRYIVRPSLKVTLSGTSSSSVTSSSAVCHAGLSTDHDQTSACRRLHGVS